MRSLREGDTQSLSHARRDRLFRRGAIVVIVAFVLAGSFGVFGYRQASETSETSDHVIELEYPSTTRAGLPAHWELTVRRRDGSPIGPVRISTSADYLDAFDHNDLVPTPDSIEQTHDAVVWIYDSIDTPTLSVTLDIRTQPDARWRYSSTTRIEFAGEAIASFDYRTWVVP